MVSGTPTKAGLDSFAATATDANGYAGTRTYKVTVVAPATFTSPPDAVVQSGLASTIDVTTKGGYPTPSLVETGDLPVGLMFTDLGNGSATITGTTAAAGSYQVTVTADAVGMPPVPDLLTIWVVGDTTTLLSPSSMTFTAGVFSSFTLTTTIPSALVGLSGLPKWVHVATGAAPTTLTVSGKPPATSAGASYPAVVLVRGLAAPASPPTFTVNVS